jgi:putative hydrolase of the HAD superfamily
VVRIAEKTLAAVAISGLGPRDKENSLSATPSIKTLFLDIGGVLLTNGWDHEARHRACDTFGLDHAEIDERHHLTFDTYEEGKLSLDSYLKRVVFYEERPFTPEAFRQFMFDQSQPFEEAIDLVRVLKAHFGLKTAAVSNEGRELTIYRIQQFDLGSVIDFFVSSCFVHFRKPDPDIYRVALDISQTSPDEVVYIDDRLMFVQVAEEVGIHGIHHTGIGPTRDQLAALGLSLT